jgi:carbonic anhydrase
MKPHYAVLALFLVLISFDITSAQSVQTKKTQSAITPGKALELLLNGNDRFVNGNMIKRDHAASVRQTSGGQFPYAAIVSCIDSRTPIELTFDQGIGDIFNVRIAGNIVNEDIVGSLEFAASVAGAKLIAIIGHTECGAVKGACDNVRLGNLTGLLMKIAPAVDSVPPSIVPRNSENKAFVNDAIKRNVLLALSEIKRKSPLLKKMIDEHTIGIVGGIYDVSNGKAVIFTETEEGFQQ